MNIFIQFIVAAITMGAIDFVWLSTMHNHLYKPEIGELLLKTPNFVAAGIFYIIYVLSLVWLVIKPAIENNSWQQALVNGAVFGLVCYATYDLTNLATLKGFNNKIVIIDIIWGTLLTATVSIVTFLVVTKWIK